MRLKQKRERQALAKNEKRNVKEHEKSRLIVDKDKWGANHYTCGLAPDYYDKSYNCVSCGKPSIWTAEQQKYFIEELGEYMYAEAIHCQICRVYIKHLKEKQKRHMANMAEKKPHTNEIFFKKKY